jgi:hypothetical protein
MSKIEGDGIMELMYYLLWRKDSPYKEHMNISIPDTVIFKSGKPVKWYFTNKEGTVLQKKQDNITYDNIIKKFLTGSKNGDIVGYFITMEIEKNQVIKSQKSNKVLLYPNIFQRIKVLTQKRANKRKKKKLSNQIIK